MEGVREGPSGGGRPRRLLILILSLNVGLIAFQYLRHRGRPVYPEDDQVAAWDGATGKPVPGARAIRRHPSESAEFPGPASLAATPISADGRGVITLSPQDMAEGVFVGAPGYAWEWLGRDELKCSLNIPYLKRGGSVRLRIPRFNEMVDPELRLGCLEWRFGRVLPNPGSEGEILYDGLPAGSRFIELRRKGVAGDSEAYGSVTGDVPPGGQVQAILEGDPAALNPEPRVTGTVTFPAGWQGPRTTLELQSVGKDLDPNSQSFYMDVPAGGGRVPFRSRRVVPGRYHLGIRPGWTTEVAVPEAGVTKDIVLPPLMTGTIRLVDAESGEPVTEAKVTWSLEEEERRTHSLMATEATGEPGEFRFRTASPRVVVHVDSPHHRLERATALDLASEMDPSGDPAPCVFRLRGAGEIKVAFRCGKESASPERLLVSRALRRDGPGWISGATTVSGGAATMRGLEPGSYNIGVDTGPDYEAVPYRLVEVVAGRTLEITIDLVKCTEALAAPKSGGR
jgi:hypothetical protein